MEGGERETETDRQRERHGGRERGREGDKQTDRERIETGDGGGRGEIYNRRRR